MEHRGGGMCWVRRCHLSDMISAFLNGNILPCLLMTINNLHRSCVTIYLRSPGCIWGYTSTAGEESDLTFTYIHCDRPKKLKREYNHMKEEGMSVGESIALFTHGTRNISSSINLLKQANFAIYITVMLMFLLKYPKR